MNHTVYIALGSNLGDRAANLAGARTALEESGVHVRRASSLYETEPQGLRDQPWFVNQVIEGLTELFPRQLLLRAKKVERALGRKRTVRNGPRVIDIDILLYGDLVVNTAGLEIPHPRMAERRFVLEPLAELAPELRHPVSRSTVRQMLKAVGDQAIRKQTTS